MSPPLVPRFLPRFGCLICASVLLCACGHDDAAKSAEARPRLQAVDYDMTIYFGIGGDSQRVRIEGWSGVERFFTWTDGTRASVALRFPSNSHDIQLRFEIDDVFVPRDLPFQPVDVFVNSEKLASWQAGPTKSFTIDVPGKLLRPPKALSVRPNFIPEPGWVALIEFHIPKATSPKQLGIGEDSRLLGLRMRELHISKSQYFPQTSRDD